jgi:hypothetical protein
MTPVRSRRGKIVHLVATGIRRDLAPEQIPAVVCGKRLKSAVVTDDDVTCDACLDIAFNQN